MSASLQTARTDADLRDYLERHHLPAKLVYPGVPTPTVPDAARALGVDAAQILKSLVFLASGEPKLVIAAGQARIRYPALAGALSVSRKRLKLATPEEALALSGFEVGATPPFGHTQALETWLDETSVRPGADPARAILYAGGGTRSALLELSLATLLSVTGARLAPLTETDSTESISTESISTESISSPPKEPS